MAKKHSVMALPWYSRADYPALLKLFEDSDKLPATYDAWLQRAEHVESQLQKAGLAVTQMRPREALPHGVRMVAFVCSYAKLQIEQ
jgi:hypothetical protein